MKPIQKMNQAELGAFIQSHLRQKGIEVILSGGACVSIYSSDKYVSYDLDLINIYFSKRSAIKSAMEEIGFVEQARYFRHPETVYMVEFPPGPLTIGSEPIKSFNELNFTTGTLVLLSPTDCVKDRLAAYYYWKDRQALSQALLVIQNQSIDLDEVARWSKVEGMENEFIKIREMPK